MTITVNITKAFTFLLNMGNFKKKMKQKCDIEGQISNQIDHNKFSIFLNQGPSKFKKQVLV